MLRRVSLSGLLLLMAGAFACQTESNPRPKVGVSESNLCSATAAVVCYNMFRCCTGEQIEESLGLTQSTTVEECRRDVKLMCEDKMAPVFWSVARGATSVNTTAYESCLEALTAPKEGCFLHTTDYPWASQCETPVFQGLLAAGLQCYYDHECLPNHYCASDAKCRALPTLGMECPQFQCAAGLFCSWDSGLCEAQRSSGMSCELSSQCQEGLYCGESGNAYTCQLPKAVGVGCAGDWECSSGYCVPGSCSNGDSCYVDGDCSGSCSLDGYDCYNDYDCDRSCQISGYYCTSDMDCPDPGDSCPANTCEASCNGQPMCGEEYIVVDYCEDALISLL